MAEARIHPMRHQRVLVPPPRLDRMRKVVRGSHLGGGGREMGDWRWGIRDGGSEMGVHRWGVGDGGWRWGLEMGG